MLGIPVAAPTEPVSATDTEELVLMTADLLI